MTDDQTNQEQFRNRQRLGYAIVLALALHLVLVVTSGLIDFVAPLPEYLGPLFVELEPIEPPPPPPEPPPPPP
ncbi:MAG: hypothetical protein EA384_02440, partial [Spirochaetaceae bacterium]